MDELEQQAHVIGVDLDDAYVTAAVVDGAGRIVGRPVTRRIECRQAAVETLRGSVVPAVLEALAPASGTVQGVGLALPGTLRPEEGLCLLSTPLGWEDVPVRDVMQQALGLPTTLVNEVRANITGELQYGAGLGVDNLVCVALGRTIEGGIVIDGRIHEGDSDSAGEIGHLTVDHDGLNCTCGNQGCLETVASGPAVARMATESLKLGAQSVLADWVSDEHPITSELVYRAAREGDALAIRVWEKVGRYLGLAMSSVITLVNPQRIIVGGKVAQAFDWFAPMMFEEIRRRARMVPRDFTQIVPSPITLDAVLLGAAWHALRAASRPPSEVGAA